MTGKKKQKHLIEYTVRYSILGKADIKGTTCFTGNMSFKIFIFILPFIRF